MNGFASCRPNLSGDWSGPAAIVIEGGGIFWPVYGSRIDVILLATNPSVASHFHDPVQVLGADPRTIPGPVRPDQNPARMDQPVIFAYARSGEGIIGISIGGATVSEDKAENNVLYGIRLSNSAILKRPVTTNNRLAIERFLASLPSPNAEQSRTRTE
jgi:lipid-binding SYLF domain-containing protein